MITVIIPYYKNASSINTTLLSVTRQTYRNLEILVINDASPDKRELEEIVITIADQRIRLLHHESNKNGSAARNTGMDAAKGMFIAFLDADDEWSTNHLEKYIAKSNEVHIQKPYCFYCKSDIITNEFDNLILPSQEKPHNSSVATNLFLEEGFIQSSGLFIRSNCSIRWNESLIRHQDYDFLFRLEEAGYSFYMSNHVGVTIHWEGNNISKKGGTWEYSLNYLNNHPEYFNKKNRQLFKFKNVIKPLLQQRNISKALKLYIENTTWMYIPLKMQLEFLDLLVFGKHKLIILLAKIKKNLNEQ